MRIVLWLEGKAQIEETQFTIHCNGDHDCKIKPAKNSYGPWIRITILLNYMLDFFGIKQNLREFCLSILNPGLQLLNHVFFFFFEGMLNHVRIIVKVRNNGLIYYARTCDTYISNSYIIYFFLNDIDTSHVLDYIWPASRQLISSNSNHF